MIVRDATASDVAAYGKAAHLKGVGGANNYFLRGVDSVDANGTKVSAYADGAKRSLDDIASKVITASATATTQASPTSSYSLPTVGSTVYPSVSTPAIASPQMPPITIPKVAQADPDIRGISQLPQKIQVTMPLQKSGRDVADRGIANIVTGGMAN